jgi:hypothetical protein
MLRTPLISLYSVAMPFRESSPSVIHMLAPPRPAILNRFALQQLIWENTLDTIELASFLKAAEQA